MDLFLTLLAKGVAQGSVYAMLGAGLGIIFNTLGVFHFAHGAIFTLSGYAIYVGVATWGLPLLPSIAFAFVVATAAGAACEATLYRPLRGRGSPGVLALLGSFAILIGVQNLLLIAFDGFSRVDPNYRSKPVRIGNIVLTQLDVAKLVIAAVVVALLAAMLYLTRVGTSIRAVVCNPRLARTVGVDTKRIYLIAIVVGSAAAVPAALVTLWDIGMSPANGATVLLVASIAVFVGGVGSPLAGAAAGLFFGVIERVSPYWFPGQWQTTIAMVVCVGFLLVRPQGFFGTKERVA